MPTAIVTANVITKVESNKQFEWYNNVLITVICNKVRKIDYWTDDWLPSQERNPDRIEVYYNNKLAFAGDIIDKIKKSPEDVYKEYASKLAQIGLPSNATSKDFVNMLNSYFPSRLKNGKNTDIGNIVFKLDEIGFADNTAKKEIELIRQYGKLELTRSDLELKLSDLKLTFGKDIPFKPIQTVRY